MRECQHCHKKVQWIIHIIDTGEQDFDPADKGILAVGQEWCIGCIYREGNHEHYKQNPPQRFTFDSLPPPAYFTTK